jgi:hypothetical protein
MTSQDFVTELFCIVDDRMAGVSRHPASTSSQRPSLRCAFAPFALDVAVGSRFTAFMRDP